MEDRWNEMRGLAERIAARAEIYETRISDYAMGWPQGLMAVITEGTLAGRRFGTYIPVTEAHVRDESQKEFLIKRAENVWRGRASSHLLRPDMLIGPKGKLPA